MTITICEQCCLLKNNITTKLQAQESNLRSAISHQLGKISCSVKVVAKLAENRISTCTTVNTLKSTSAHDLVIPISHAKLHPDYIRTKNLNRSGRNVDFVTSAVIQ